ncbi:Oidioi.mRNA.OKI2018_I69.PAR.g11148.t1.cds [Oikopleura dioica]|uniref:Oidioi.mRNA.OKI2018_I69.PAR.g11148.t1.cds n=1 Tax=Oikopleura dioica TaxID=34765 RepID=A0ABN7RV11_OIKDI|nr:Oidioi.mRNA.OKI2018_I69.PAR.g11148.t1.cds [Oikopleura dioica]
MKNVLFTYLLRSSLAMVENCFTWNLKELRAVILLHGNPFQCSCDLAAIVSEIHFVDGPTAATCDTFGDLVPLRKLISLTEENVQCATESAQDIPMYIIFFSWVVGLMVTLYRYSKAESNSSEENYNKIDPVELERIRKEAIEIQNRINQNRDSEMQKIRHRRSKCPTHSNCSSCKELNTSGVQPTRCTHTVESLRNKFKESGRQMCKPRVRECEAFDDISMNAATSRHFKVRNKN